MNNLGMKDASPSDFRYQRRPSLPSLLWSMWLRAPRSLRIAVYRCLLRMKQETNSPFVSRLPFGLYAKSGSDISVVEALATQYVSAHTTIPVTTVLDVLVDESLSKGGAFFLMTRVAGVPMPQTGTSLNTASEQQLTVFAKTMKDWLEQLRSLPCPTDGAICGFMGTSIFSYRISHSHSVGPFQTQDNFHAQPHATLSLNSSEAVHALAMRLRKTRYRICFTHGDLNPNNILVNHNFKPVGLVDWQCAAWMPEYWEFTSAVVGRQRNAGWNSVFKDVFPQYEEELALERELWKTTSPF